MEHNSSRRQTGTETGDHISVEISDLNETLASTIKEKMEEKSPSVCIYRIPDQLRKENQTSYMPDKVSIGPFHHGNPSLQPMEDQKWRYLRTLLGRRPTVEASLDECVKAMRELEQRARNCYSEQIDLTSDQFVEMMLVDGCFIIELFFRYMIKGLRRKGDPVFNTDGMLFSLRRDMILLENQIPFIVLQRLFDLIPLPKQCIQSLPELAFHFLKVTIMGNKHVLHNKFTHEGNHLLDLLRNFYHPATPRVEPLKQQGMHKGVRCATMLRNSGVKLKMAMEDSLLDIKFVHGELRIPPLKINGYSETILRNLIALEQCYSDSTISSYVILMDNLIHSTKDVRLLSRNGEQVNGYYSTSWHTRWAKLKRTPQAIPLLIVVILLLFLTFTGTLFSALSFFLSLFQSR